MSFLHLSLLSLWVCLAYVGCSGAVQPHPLPPVVELPGDGGEDGGGEDGGQEGGENPEPDGGGAYVLTVTEDTYVRSDLPNNNQGGGTNLVADADMAPDPVLNKSILLRFQVGGGTFTQAQLQMYSSNGSLDGARIYRTTEAWSEMGTTYNNLGSVNGALLATVPSLPTDGLVSVDLTSAVQPHQPLSLAIVAASGDGIVLNAREAISDPPQLKLTTSNAAPYACATCPQGETCDGQKGLCGCSANSCAASRVCSTTGRCVTPFKAMQFNIFEGGAGTLLNGMEKIDAIASIIRAAAPDIVTLSEVNSEPLFAALATKTSMSSYLCRATNGYHLAVLSTRPFASQECFTGSPITKSVAVVSVSVGGRAVYVVAGHPNATAGAEAQRVEEITKVLELAQAKGNVPRLIMGDFNSESPMDGKGGQVTPVLTHARFVDSYRAVHPVTGTFPGTTWTDGVAIKRLDYIFHDDVYFRATASDVINAPTPWPSDHYAVTTQFELR